MNIDIFRTDAFSLSTLSVAINQVPHAPTRIGELGLFNTDGIRTTSMEVEWKSGVITLVPAKDRGAPGTPKNVGRRKMETFKAIHLPQLVALQADEVQNARAFGEESEAEVATSMLAEKTAVALLDLDVTLEWQRLGAIKGQVLDADGTTVLEDMFTKFGVSQNQFDMDFDETTTEVNEKCRQIKRLVEDELGGLTYKEIRVFCGSNFFDALVKHESVKDAYRLYQNSSVLRADNRSGFTMSENVVFEEYRGKVGGTYFIATGEAYAVPMGVPNLFVARFAPANYMETVNTKGLRVYQKVKAADWDKGVESEIQSNPIHICTRPRAVIRLYQNEIV